MKKMLVLLLLVTGEVGWGKTVGLWQDARSYIREGMLATLKEAGWQTVILQGAGLSDEGGLAELDVVFLPGGWNAYWFANFPARRSLVKFVAGGKGILAGAFRSGYVRTANRPFFPEVGATYNRVNGPYVSGHGDSELAKAIDQPFCPGGWDHLVVKLGPKGKVFAVSGKDPVGVYGEVYGGRYLIFGAFIGIDAKTEPMQGTARRALLTMLDWLNAAPKLSDAKKAEHQAQADLDFLRREMLCDWTLDERGPDRGLGLLPNVRNGLAVPLESRLYTLQYMSQHLSGRQGKQCRSEAKALGKAVAKLRRNYEKERARVTDSIAKMGLEELLAENPAAKAEEVLKKIEETAGRTEEEKKKIVAVVKRCAAKRPPVYASKQVATYLHGDAIREKLFPGAQLRKLVAEADKVLSELRPAVKAAKVKAAAQERAQDLAMLPELIKRCAADDVVVRREAVLELGRIGAPQAASTLIKMLNDPDEKVRTDAAIGLGWMQSKEAVPALIKVAEGSDIPLRRRAVQALGQIGDLRAVPVLMACAESKDYFVSENAILGLGWLQAKAAVPRLLKIVTDSDPQNPEQRGLMLAAIRALGHIGDERALPLLEKLAKEATDFPFARRGGKRISNIYSTAQTLGVQGHAELALAEIKAGGRGEVGIKQAGFLATKDKFYGLTRRFNALVGRMNLLFDPNFKHNPADLFPYLWEAGFTGIHQAWGQPTADPDEYVKMVEAASELGLHWIEVMPFDSNFFGSKNHYKSRRQHGIEKPGAEVTLLKYQDVPAFHGFWSEESYPDVKMTAAEFEAWLQKKYGAGFRKKLGLAADQDLTAMTGKNYPEYRGPLKTEYLQFCGEKLVAHWRESQEWLHGVRKGCAFTFSVTCILTVKYPGLSGRAGTAIDVNGPESYQCFGRYNSFFMEMYKDGEAKPVMCEFYNWYGPSPAHDVRGFAQHLMHGECFYNFCLNHIFDQASNYDLWSWDAERWGHARSIFRKARDLGEYLRVPASAANVGLLCSELSYTPFYVDNLHESRNSLLRRWYQHQAGLWTALNQSQIPTDIIWAETLTKEKLNRYRVLVLSDAKIITNQQAELIRAWVNGGGTLIASGTTSLFDEWATLQKDYGLADLFGVSYVGHVGVSDPNQIDTYCWKPGGHTTFKAVSGLDPQNFRYHVHRHAKPIKSLRTYAVSGGSQPYLPGLAQDTACEYDLPLGYDKVKPGSAAALAKFANGDPALTVNKVGQGLCYLWTPIYPGLCYVSSEWEMQPNRLDFWPNVRELLAAMVQGGLSHQGAALPVEVTGVSKEVEVTLRQQPEHSRWMVHLLNYDPNLERVKRPRLIVHPPAGRAVKRMFYPDTDTSLKFKASGDGVTARMRDFEVHDMLVVEWERNE